MTGFSQLKLLVVLLLICWCAPLSAGSADGIVGRWLTEGGTGKIEIFKCGQRYCGRTIWIKPTKEHPHPENKLDVNNPNPKKRSRKLLNARMMWGLTYNAEENEWENGSIYDPGRGKVYSCKLKMENGGNTVLLRGYMGISLIGKTTRWTRLK